MSIVTMNPIVLSAVGAEFNLIAGEYINVVNQSLETISMLPVLNVGAGAEGMLIQHSTIMGALARQQALITQTAQSLATHSTLYAVSEALNVANITNI